MTHRFRPTTRGALWTAARFTRIPGSECGKTKCFARVGQPGIYGVVEMKIATGVVALREDGQTMLVGQWRYPLDQYSWEIVEGAADHEESPQAAAARELQEEAGLGARSWRQLGEPLWVSNSVTNEVAYLYLAEDPIRPAAGARRNRAVEDRVGTVQPSGRTGCHRGYSGCPQYRRAAPRRPPAQVAGTLLRARTRRRQLPVGWNFRRRASPDAARRRCPRRPTSPHPSEPK